MSVIILIIVQGSSLESGGNSLSEEGAVLKNGFHTVVVITSAEVGEDL